MPPPETTVEDAPAVLVRDLWFHYPDGRSALNGVDFAIGEGEIVALVGPNGAGKSTLLLHLNGLLPGRSARILHSHGDEAAHVHEGPSVWIEGMVVDRRNGPSVRRKVGLLFQDPDDQLVSPTVLEDVAFGPRNLGLKREEAFLLAMECLARVEMADAADRVPHHLSFGERKRVCLAGVLACRPTILVLDEPTANLDPRGRRRFVNLIKTLGVTTLIATHDLEMALELCGRVLLLDDGRLVADGPAATILGDAERMDAHGLEVPISLRLASGPIREG